MYIYIYIYTYTYIYTYIYIHIYTYGNIYSKISFTIFDTKNDRDGKKLNISYTNHIAY